MSEFKPLPIELTPLMEKTLEKLSAVEINHSEAEFAQLLTSFILSKGAEFSLEVSVDVLLNTLSKLDGDEFQEKIFILMELISKVGGTTMRVERLSTDMYESLVKNKGFKAGKIH